MKWSSNVLFALCAAAASGNAIAQGDKPRSGTTSEPVLQSWMNPEVGGAWKDGYKGKGATVTVVDDFSSGYRFYGNLGTGTQLLRHGEWTLREASMIAPSATMRSHDFYSGKRVSLSRGLNILNLSYGMFAPEGYTSVRWSAQESSIIAHARDGKAVVSKAAGNDYGTAVGQPNSSGHVDYLNRDLIGKQSALFVGALNKNGSVTSPASLASYSNIAGADAAVQKQFVVVGVESDKTGLAGTSFAAPIVSGYAAILGSKFNSATPTQITNQLLNTARQDTIHNYNPASHGRGEASIFRALAPVSIQ